MFWFVLYVKAQSERKVALALRKKHIEVFCPTRTEIRQWSDRKKKVEHPLFKSYVFVKLLEKDRNRVFEVPNVVRYLFWLGKPAIVRDEEIKVIKEWIKDDSIDELSLSQYSAGDEIVIKKGVLRNQKAIIQHVDRKYMRLVLKNLGIIVQAKTKEVV